MVIIKREIEGESLVLKICIKTSAIGCLCGITEFNTFFEIFFLHLYQIGYIRFHDTRQPDLDSGSL